MGKWINFNGIATKGCKQRIVQGVKKVKNMLKEKCKKKTRKSINRNFYQCMAKYDLPLLTIYT